MCTTSTTTEARRLVIFDGDDTLWSTMPLYTAAKQRFAAIVADMLPATIAIARLDELDRNNVQLLGFSKERFPRSLLECYRMLCSEYGRIPDPDVENDLTESGNTVFASPAVNMPNVEMALKRLAGRCDLVLATKGDPVVQLGRIHRSQLAAFFRQVHILTTKTDRDFAAILASCGYAPSQAWSIGNSVRSDINPAIRTGMSAVLIHRPTWEYEDEPLLPAPRAFAVESLTEAVEVVLERSD